ncbi:MAG: VWA domain-containing protein [Bauldia sp.]|nr:VWA domain-containing protein [Bauldia sp.]
MTFVAPLWLFVLAAAAVVLLLHARRRRSVGVPSIQIWRLIENTAARRPNIRRPPLGLPLVLQLLALLLAAFALAQPRIGAPPDDHVVFLLDASGSMRTTDVGPTRFEAAKTRLAAMVDTLGEAGSSRISVIVAASEPFFAVARQAGPSGIRPLIDDLAPAGGIADWTAAARLVPAVAREGETMRVVALTDDGAALGALAAALPGVPADTVPFGSPVGNRTLTASVTAAEDAADTWTVTGAVHFFGEPAGPVEIAVAFRRAGDDGYLDFGTITVTPDPAEAAPAADPGLPAAIPFTAELRLPGPGALVLGLPPDAAPHDDAAYFTLAPGAPRALLIGPAGPDLLRALGAAGIELSQSAELPADRGAAFDLVIVNDVTVDAAPATNVLWLQRGRLASEAAPVPLADAYFSFWDAGHPLSAGIDWSDIAVPRAFALPARTDADPVVAAAGGPIIDARSTTNGRDVRVALGIDASRWGAAASFPLFMANLIDWLALPPTDPTGCTVGTGCRIPAGYALVGVSAPDLAPLAPLRSETFMPNVAGIYRFSGHGRTLEIAANAALAESDLPSPPEGAGWAPPGAFWWRALLLAAIAVLAVELVVAGRGVERFFRRGALQGRDGATRRRRLQLVLRGLALLALLGALVSLPFAGRSPNEAIVVVDATGDTIISAPPGDGLVVAGNPPAIGRDLRDPGEAAASRADPTGIDLEGALRLAAAQLPADIAGRIAVAGSGITTAGNAEAAIPLLGARRIAVDVLPAEAMAPGEALVAAVAPPASLFAGDRFTLNAFIASASPGPATVTVFRDGEAVSSLTVDLAAGSNRIEASFAAATAGEHLFEVAVAKAGDTTEANNRSGALVAVRPAPRVMVVAPDTAWGEVFASALRIQGMDATVVPPDRTPNRMRLWLAYDLVVLLTVPAIDLLTAQQELLAEFVEVHGRGLMILGGESAFGPGGYYRTELERISPLSSRVPQDAPGAAIVFVLDRSGSMIGPVEDTNRLTIAKEATIAAVELLHPETQVGVTVFDSEAHRLLPLQPQNLPALEAALDPLQPGGGTELYPGIADAVEQLLAADAQAKHIVVLTDGLLGPRDFAPIIAEATAGGITISAVAIGSTADFQRASQIARLGGGAFHATQDFRALPSILSQEALMLSRSPLEVRETPVFWVDRSAPFLAGLPDALPPLDAYVTTTARPGATLHLAAVDEDGERVPILASWRYGNGSVVAFASHGAGMGSQRWLAMPEYALLWGQMARHLVEAAPATGLTVDTLRRGDAVTITVTALDADGLPLAGEAPALELPEGMATAAFVPKGAGVYAATVARPAAGRLDATVRLGDDAAGAPTWFGYPAMLDFAAARPDGLVRLAAATGGAVVTALPAVSADRWTLMPAWRPWLVIGLALFLAELWIRYGALRAFRGRAAPLPERAADAKPWLGLEPARTE